MEGSVWGGKVGLLACTRELYPKKIPPTFFRSLLVLARSGSHGGKSMPARDNVHAVITLLRAM